MDNARAWCELRKLWLEIGLLLPQDLGADLQAMIAKVAPTTVPDGKQGDFGYVLFSDGSQIKYDWDDGTFTCESTGASYAYPWDQDDPLFWARG